MENCNQPQATKFPANAANRRRKGHSNLKPTEISAK